MIRRPPVSERLSDEHVLHDQGNAVPAALVCSRFANYCIP